MTEDGASRHGVTAEALSRLAAFLAEAARGPVTIARLGRIRGGAIQENWRLDIAVGSGPLSGRHKLVLRLSSLEALAFSHTRAEEFAILRAAYDAGVAVPEPLWLGEDPGVLGRPFLVMRRLRGTAIGRKVVRDARFAPVRQALAERLGEELGKIHRIRPGHPGLTFLGPAPDDPAAEAIAHYRAALDSDAEAHPVLEWGLRWAERRAPRASGVVLCHRDYRTGNYLVDAGRRRDGLTGILDWEFAGWGAPEEDLAWFCAKCWRFGVVDREAGGIAERAPFYRGYRRVSGREIDPAAIHFWEVIAHVRWAVIALHQTDRHLSGAEPSLELAAIGRRPPEMELEVLRLTGAL